MEPGKESHKFPRCKAAMNTEIDGRLYKVVVEDACAKVNRVLAKHEGATAITSQEWEALRNSTATNDTEEG